MKGSGCKNCPVNEWDCDAQYRGSRCASLRRAVSLGNPMTNADRIRAMSDEELAEFILSIVYARNTPWSDLFTNTFCKNCPTTVCAVDGYKSMDLHECDFVDGKCPHGSDVVWWLQQPAKEDSNDRT